MRIRYGWLGHMVACSDDGGGDGEAVRARTGVLDQVGL